MQHVTLIGDSLAGLKALRSQLDNKLDFEIAALDQALGSTPGGLIVFDIDLANVSPLLKVKEWLRYKPANAKAIFLVDKSSHLQQTRAFSIGATDVLPRQASAQELLKKLWDDVASLSADFGNEAIHKSPAISAAVDTLHGIFASACDGVPIDTASAKSAGDKIVGHVETEGLAVWVETVRTHHSLTYQHCLLVTGLAVAFGQLIGVSKPDRLRLSLAGMLHDVGKARIPLAILEKPSRLNDDELEVMKKHPEFGLDALNTMPGLPAEMLDMVVHHHEYLDGSGYPHGLRASEIADLVRMITIADVFGALIERRSYKPPLSAAAAYQILREMGPKLDEDLVRAFQAVADLGLNP